MSASDASAAPDHLGRIDVRECSDKELMARHTGGDPDAFGELFRRHKDRMWGVALRTCGNPDLAADAVQDAFMSAFRRSDSYRGEAAVTTWLHRITVNAVSPGVINTPFHEKFSTLEQLESMRLSIPMARLGTVDECVGAFLYFASEQLSGYVTGQIIEVNGGQYMP